MEKITDKIMPYFMKFAGSKPITALKDGFILTMPLTLLGSIFMLIAAFPIPGWDSFMAGIFGADWSTPLWNVVGATFDIVALIAVFGTAYAYVKSEDIEAVPAGILGIVSFLIVTNSFVLTEAGEKIGGVIPKSWTGGQGMVAAIIVGLFVGYVYTLFIKKDIRIKMPESVPTGVTNAFTSLIPGFVIMATSLVVSVICTAVKGMSMTEIIYEIIQSPLQNLSDSFVGVLVICLLISLFWWFGLHGPNIVMGVMAPILTANSLANQKILDAGGTLIAGENAAIVTPQFIDIFVKFGGTSITLGLIIAALLVARSAQVKQLSKMSLIPGLFNINEPVIFGLPIVFNPVMFVPFILVPLLAAVITYGAISFGFMTPFGSVQVPWTTPPVISGFLLAGWQGAVVQVGILAMAVAVYLPFVKAQDKIALQEESK